MNGSYERSDREFLPAGDTLHDFPAQYNAPQTQFGGTKKYGRLLVSAAEQRYDGPLYTVAILRNEGGETMNRFAYREAQTVQEAIDMLRQEEGGRIVAGATDVLIRWRQGVWKPTYVLNIKRIPGLDEVQL